jgi:hypothetical protein
VSDNHQCVQGKLKQSGNDEKIHENANVILLKEEELPFNKLFCKVGLCAITIFYSGETTCQSTNYWTKYE